MIREEKEQQTWNKEREGKEKLSHRLIDEDEITSFNPKSIKTIFIYLIYFPLMGFWRAKPRLNLPKESQASPQKEFLNRKQTGAVKTRETGPIRWPSAWRLSAVASADSLSPSRWQAVGSYWRGATPAAARQLSCCTDTPLCEAYFLFCPSGNLLDFTYYLQK